MHGRSRTLAAALAALPALVPALAGCTSGDQRPAATVTVTAPAASPPPSTPASPPAPERPAPGPSGQPPAPALAHVQRVERAEALDRLGGAGPAADAEGGALQFTDRNGRNLVVLSRTGDGRSAHLDAHHFVLTDGAAPRLLRHVQDGVDECELDLSAEFLTGSLQVGDADADGLAEVTFAYATACRSDVSPASLKLLLLEDGQKFIVRGGTTFPDVPESQGWSDPGTPEPALGSWPAGTGQEALERFERYRSSAEAELLGRLEST